MEQLITEIRQYATDRGVSPSTVLQRAAGLSGRTWRKWEERSADCSMGTADKIRAYMAENPPQAREAAE